ncbi:unnamed protein product [marine sediment metagenome]|uniref:Uncharacterized protein n=1 Tax=marine sediment metagenome TaxID=412755 RepID=X1QDY7_9ZZZZ
MLNQRNIVTRGPYVVGITKPNGECWKEKWIDNQYGESQGLPAFGEKEWVPFHGITPLLYKDTLYRIVVHTMPGWETWDGEKWVPKETWATIYWWAKLNTNPYPRGMAWHGCNFRAGEGAWIAHPTEDFAFILWRTCP